VIRDRSLPKRYKFFLLRFVTLSDQDTLKDIVIAAMESMSQGKKEELLKDEEIVDRILKGETELYALLIRRFNRRLYRISMSIVNNDMEAEDVMQTAYLNAYLQLPGFQNKSGFGTWLTRILINESLLHKKKQLKRRQLASGTMENDHSTFNPLNELMNKELKRMLETAVSNLPEKYRLVFVMREIEEMSTLETMDILRLSESNVKVRLNRAKEMLRNELSAYYRSEQVFEFNLVRCDRIERFVTGRIADYHRNTLSGTTGVN
jgi:RNA polymerase sigma factor (sigma-70 family)